MSQITPKSTALQAISTPLTAVTLIEASAGTGKTFTMASLYLRLLLNIGDNAFGRPLMVDEILVVTFTEASTQELKARIRQRIQTAKNQFMAYAQNRDLSAFIGTENEFLVMENGEPTDRYLVQLDLNLAIQQLQFAEQNMDLAAIYTIHGFCRRMLMQYAVNSGIHFNLDLVKDETALLTQLCNAFWREHFYPQPLAIARFIQKQLKSPQELLKTIQPYLTGETLKVSVNRPHLLELPLNSFLQQEILASHERLASVTAEIKAKWRTHISEIQGLFVADFASGKSRFKANMVKPEFVQSRVLEVEIWLNDEENITPPENLWRFTQSYLASATKKNFAELEHPFFAWLDEQKGYFDQLDEQTALHKKVVLYHCIKILNQRLSEHKQNHPEKGFNDLLRLLNIALKSEQGQQLAELIRHQYSFAMIDEFQDTDEQQYEIFSQIYLNQADCGFMMIGDPKQAIYQFRGADIFTYLKAADDAGQQRFTLDKNYRSTPALIDAVNQLLDFDAAFLYDKIPFEPVKAGRSQPQFVFNGEPQAPLQFYVNAEESIKLDDMAECCAEGILRWLQGSAESNSTAQSAVENQAIFVDGEDSRIVQSDDIAVLVRSGSQAEKVQNALRKRGIASVYLSDRSNVFDTKEARELALVLTACLYPTNERHILNAIATGIFALSAVEIQQIKQSEELLEKWVSRFEKYQQLWQRQGVLPMCYQLLLEQDESHGERNIPEKMLALPKGERRLTDLLHLAELLQQAAPLQESEAALLRWFERQVQGSESDRADETQVRLESEQKLVKIVTIHKSKGLEYGLVWLPFLGYNSKEFSQDVTTYHSDGTNKYWDMDGLHQSASEQEEFAESLRLLYVALTRAKHQLAIVVPTEFDDKWNALLYVLTQGAIGKNKKVGGKQKGLPLVEAVQTRLGQALCQIDAVLQGENARQFVQTETEDIVQAARFTGEIEQNWGITSFTGLTAMHERQLYRLRDDEQGRQGLLNDDALDYDKVDNPLSFNALNENALPIWQDFPTQRSPFDFPAGTKFGLTLHKFFEKNAFNQPVSAESAVQICHDLQLDESWQAPLQQWLSQVLQAPLGQGFCLADLAPQDCLKELQFYLKINRTFDVKAFNQALRDFHPLFEQPYLFDEIQGMLRGFVDLVFRHNEKYYLLDYKTNMLGINVEDYQNNALNVTMKAHHYDLQYLIYSLALHRYLQTRDPHYDYAQHFGGVIYTFVRGMNGQGTNGVYFDCPDVRLIQALENLFYA